MAKLHELGVEYLPHPQYPPYLASVTVHRTQMNLQRKRFGSNDEVFAETEAFFVRKKTNYYEVIEMSKN